MTRRETYEAKTEELLQPLVDAHGFELVDVEYVKEAGNWYLRAYIDKPGGIAVDDCEVISRALSDKLDEEDYIEDSYILEVSSPGLGRPLKKDKDFQRSIGKEIEARTFRAIDKLDEEDYIEDSYILEVSSPGLGRPLKKDKDFQRSIGKEIEVRTFRAIDKQKEFIGILKEFNKDSFTIVIEDNEMTFQRSETALVRLAFDF